jgi:uncharacterized protein YecT (DUF1311 family)
MTDNLTVEGDGAGGQPNSPVSKPAIEGADSLSKLLDAKLTEALKPLLGEIRGVQGKADRLDKSQREFLDEYERQKKDGKSQAEAESAATKVISERSRAQMRDDALDLLLKREGLLSDQPVGNGAVGTVDAAKVFAELELPENAETAALKQRTYGSADEAYATAAKYLAAQKSKPVPTDADRATPPASPPSRGGLTAEEYRKNMLAIPKGSAGKTQREALKEQARKEGVDVDNIIFS